MPTYEYHCANGHHFEDFQSIVAAPLETCPVCGAHAEREISGGSGLIFKGSGFYITDYAKKNSSDTKSVTSAKSKETTESSTAKTEKSDSAPTTSTNNESSGS
jgi:putative FmdB family regulatory protein